uniref:50S ribosomal protein L18 n=1 Tax=Kalanchoe fedtschenkoi TaxID=63787 RepID=A0A7N0TDN5_KALFE
MTLVCVVASSSVPSTSSLVLSCDLIPTHSVKRPWLSWTSSFPQLQISSNSVATPFNPVPKKGAIVCAAWTRRSRSEAAKKPNKKSWKQRTDMYMRPFMLSVFISKRFVYAKVMHRGTSKVISVATTNARDLRNSLPSLTDHNACRVIGKLIAERSKEADVFALSYETKKDERVEGKLAVVLDTIQENGIIFV